MIVVYVTNRTMNVTFDNGDTIEAIVVRDYVLDENGLLIEDTDDYYAADEDQNVWYLGEDSAEYVSLSFKRTKIP